MIQTSETSSVGNFMQTNDSITLWKPLNNYSYHVIESFVCTSLKPLVLETLPNGFMKMKRVLFSLMIIIKLLKVNSVFTL